MKTSTAVLIYAFTILAILLANFGMLYVAVKIVKFAWGSL